MQLQRSQNEIKNAERVLSDLESKTSTCRDRYRTLMTELKKDIRKTEDEVRVTIYSLRISSSLIK